jgi:hypothetical protein
MRSYFDPTGRNALRGGIGVVLGMRLDCRQVVPVVAVEKDL